MAESVRGRALHGCLFGVSISLILGLTLWPPNGFEMHRLAAEVRYCAAYGSPSPLHQRMLNVGVMVLPALLAWLPSGGRRRLSRIAVVLALPPLVEVTQYALPGLRRTCDMTDLADNWIGVAMGSFAAGLLAVAMRLRPDRAPSGAA